MDVTNLCLHCEIALGEISMKLILVTVLALGSSIATPPALAASDPCSSGHTAIVRVSELTATGSIAGFNKAVDDHAKWYASHGYKDKIFAAPIMTYDSAKNTLTPSPKQIMTFHLNSVEVPKDKHDAAWDAYVAEYRANSNIKSTTFVCYPD